MAKGAYLGNNRVWEVCSHTNENVNINLITNQSDLSDVLGAIFTLSYGDYLENFIWQGNQITLTVPAYITYTLTFSNISGYKTPDSIEYTAISGNSRTITATYNTELVTVNVEGNGGIPTDYIITVNGITQTSTTNTYKIAYGTTYTVSASDVNGFVTPSTQTFTANQVTRTVQVTYVYNPYKITTIRIDQTITDPDSMITRIVDEGGVEAIRANSHRYVGALSNGVMLLMLLDDTDSTKFTDGTDASTYLRGYGIISTYDAVGSAISSEVFMKLPQFYYKCSQYATNQWDFTVAYGGKPDNTYKEWDGKDLIGVYEATMTDFGPCSISGNTSTESISQSDFKSYLSWKSGSGYSLVKWKHHCMMAMLFYTYYGTTNCQAVCGSGTSSYNKTTGATDSLGMTDTTTANGNSMSINFWGLENWWGNKYEWIDNVESVNRVWTVTEDDGSTRTIGTQVGTNGYISKMLFGENIDLMPTAASGASSTTGFCDYNYYGSGTMVLARSCDVAVVYGGVAFVSSNSSASYSNSVIGSRLAYRGDYEIVS